MNDYQATRIDATPCSEDVTDILAAMLADIGYESFVPDANGLTAYIPIAAYHSGMLDSILTDFPMPGVTLSHYSELVPGRDWNAEWEQHYFKPIVVDDRCVVHSTFHTDFPRGLEYDIVIDPKMAFGTGHHATTTLMMRALLSLDVVGKNVLDMGTGTGILAILAAMRGAATVTAVEIDPAAHANAIENTALNHHPEIDLRPGDAKAIANVSGVDILLANINRNVITADLPAYVATLAADGVIVLSGFYVDDIPVVEAAAHPLGLVVTSTSTLDHWTSIQLRRR